MPDSWVTVLEAAELVGRSDQTIRRWCREGRVVARKSGRDWLIDPSSLPRARRRPRSGPRTSIDLEQAWEHVRNHDLKQDTWIPDCLRFEDLIGDSDGVLAEAAAAVAGAYVPDPVQRLRVPKGQLLTRTAALPSLRDRVIYQAAVAAFASRADALLSEGVLSARLANGDRRFFFKRSSDLFGQFQDRTRDAVDRGYGFVVVVDVAAYFDNIDHRLLFGQIQSLNPPEEALKLLGVQLNAWDLGGGTGIPQGPNASRLLGNLYLAPVDLAVENSGLDVVYLRFQDDIRIAAKTSADAVRAARILEREMQRRRLTPAASKSRILAGDEAEALTGDPTKDTVTYLVNSGAVDLPRKELRKMLDRALSRRDPNWSDVRFSLWRLSLLRDSGRLKRILTSLDMLGPEASLVAAYLLPWLHQSRVMNAIEDYLTDPERNLSEFMAIWLLAALVEASEITPHIEQYARRTYRDRNVHRDLRVMAANVAGRHGNKADGEVLEQTVRTELDSALVRGFLVALRRAGPVPRQLLTEATRRFPDLKPTAAYLTGRDQLPSLIYADRKVTVPG